MAEYLFSIREVYYQLVGGVPTVFSLFSYVVIY